MSAINDEITAQVLRQIELRGSDLTQPMVVDFHLLSPSAAIGEALADAASQMGFSTSVKFIKETGRWTCSCSKSMIAKHSEIVQLEKQLDLLCKKMGGQYDGFGTIGNASRRC